jgi:hypothetical protein
MPYLMHTSEARTKTVPCHEVADGFDFPASHRKIKKELVLVNSSLCTADSNDAAPAAEWA